IVCRLVAAQPQIEQLPDLLVWRQPLQCIAHPGDARCVEMKRLGRKLVVAHGVLRSFAECRTLAWAQGRAPWQVGGPCPDRISLGLRPSLLNGGMAGRTAPESGSLWSNIAARDAGTVPSCRDSGDLTST